MARNRKLITDQDLQEAMDRHASIRVFQDDHVVDSGGVVIRFTDTDVVIQNKVSELAYYRRDLCEFFEMAKR
jgi:hypothetical protein